MAIVIIGLGQARAARRGYASLGGARAENGRRGRSEMNALFLWEFVLYPPIFPTIAASPACVALLKTGAGPLRVYQFGNNPEQPQEYPYMTWQRSGGQPENYVNQTPDMDAFSLQIDVYAKSADQARTVAAALRDALEPVSYITAWLGESRDPETKNYRFTFLNDWLTER